ncbi:unnamed protein product [Auanema sp. JU1783]|nr:unnamed protein product [Auanema sp. JU1783]
MRRTVSMEHATNILSTNIPSDDDSSADDEMTSFRSSEAIPALPKPSSADSLPNYYSNPPLSNKILNSEYLTALYQNARRSSTPDDNEEKLEVSPPHSLRVPTVGSSSSLLSPRTVHSCDFETSNQSNAIRLVASAAELTGSKGSSSDVFRNDTKSSMISSEALIPVKRESERSFFVDGSLESLQENERSNSSLMHQHCSDIPHDEVSSSTGSLCGLSYAHKRSFSADVVPGTSEEQPDPNIENVFHSRAKSQDSMTKQDSTNLNNSLPFSSPETEEIPRANDAAVYSSAGSPNMEVLNSSVEPLPDSPWVDDQLSPTRIFDFPDNRPRNHVDLPAISEECEQDAIPRSIELTELIGMYDPDVCSPTTFSQKDDLSISPVNSPPIPIHRRVVSDNHILYGNNNDFEMKVEVRPREHSTRTGTVSSRCKSQVMLNKAEELEGAKVERNLSSSDSALNIGLEAPDVPTVPPPVVISRKNSTAQASSWQRFLPSGGANPHNVIIPSTASIPTRTIKRTESSVDNLNVSSLSRHVDATSGNGSATSFMRRSLRFLSNVGSRASGSPRSLDYDLLSSVSPSSTTIIQDEFPTLRRRATAPHRKSSRRKARSDRSRIEKKKEKGSSEPFFFSLLGTRGRAKKSKERPSVDSIFSNASSRNLPQSASFPLRRPGDSHRPGIPAFAEGLPDNISRVFSPTDLDEGGEPERTDLHSQLLENPKWSRLGLFTDMEYQTWHEKYRHDKLSEKLIKKQDAIYELIMIERQHCANLVFLQQGYRMRLLEENVLSQAEVNALIPDVIDALLLFHCNLLEQLIERQKSSDEVETISDILARELSDEGSHTAVCINAYTTFGTAKQKAEQTFSNLKAKNSKFTEFLKNCEMDKLYRRYEYKSIMAKIIGRPTKYCLLLETIARNELNQFSKFSEYTSAANQAAKRFALRIDQNLMVAQLARHWEKVRSHFDMNSYTCIYIPDSQGGSVCLKWTLYDICSEINENGRRLMCLGDVWWKVHSGGSAKLNPVTMVLFDDILVLLVKKNTKMAFASNDQAVLPVSNLILRTSGKGQSIMLASAVKPTLLEFEFHTKSDMAKWSTVLDNCINVTRIPIRLSYNNEDKIVMQEERKIKEEEEMWFRKLNKLFAERCDQEKMLADYLASRRRFLEELKAHVYSLSWSGRTDLQERVRDAIKVKFRDLRNSRTVPLNKLVEDMSRAKELELLNFFNDEFVDGNDSDSSNSDSSTGKGVRPRRIKTFNGATDASSKGKLQLRRHTTVPRMSESSENGVPATRNSLEIRREKDEIDEQIHQMPLSQPLSTRRGCSRLIKDCERLKTENILLKNELALEKIRVVTLEKVRPIFSPTVTAPGETMEALRKKEKAVREDDARRRSEIEDQKQDLLIAQDEFNKIKSEWEEQVSKEKADLYRRESEIAEKWTKLRDVESRAGRLPVSTPTRIPYEKEPKTPNSFESV